MSKIRYLPEIEQEDSFLQVGDELLKVILIGEPAIEIKIILILNYS